MILEDNEKLDLKKRLDQNERGDIMRSLPGAAFPANGLGGLAEWSKAAVLKTVEPRGSRGSNPWPTAIPAKRRSTGRLFYIARDGLHHGRHHHTVTHHADNPDQASQIFNARNINRHVSNASPESYLRAQHNFSV